MASMASIEQTLRAQQDLIAELQATQSRHLQSLLELQKLQGQISELQTWTHDHDIATRRKKLELQYKDLFDELCREAARPPPPMPVIAVPKTPRSSPPRQLHSLPSPTSLGPVSDMHMKSFTGSPRAAILSVASSPTPRRGSKRPRAPSPIPEEEEGEQSEEPTRVMSLRAKKPVNYAIKPLETVTAEDESSSHEIGKADHDKLVDYMVAPHRSANHGIDWNYFVSKHSNHSKPQWTTYYYRHRKEIEAAVEKKSKDLDTASSPSL